MKFSFAAAVAAVAAVLALSAPAVAAPSEVSIHTRACPKANGILDAVDGLLLTVAPELKPLLDGVSGLESALGQAIPAVKSLLDLLDNLCV